MVRPSTVLRFRQTAAKQWGWTMRENKVPHYQKLYQQNDGKRLWMKHPRSPYLYYPFLVMMWTSLITTQYGLVRMMFGHKTWFSEG